MTIEQREAEIARLKSEIFFNEKLSSLAGKLNLMPISMPNFATTCIPLANNVQHECFTQNKVKNVKMNNIAKEQKRQLYFCEYCSGISYEHSCKNCGANTILKTEAS